MLTVGMIVAALHDWAPAQLAWEKDNVGLILGSADTPVRNVLVTLDVTADVVDEALRRDANVIVAHHPPIFHPLRTIRTDTRQGRMIAALLQRDIAVVAAHTNADIASGGLNRALAELLGLRDIAPLAVERDRLIRLSLIVDGASTRAAHDALTAAGADAAADVTAIGGDVMIDAVVTRWALEKTVRGLRTALGAALRSHAALPMLDPVPGIGLGAIGSLPEPLSQADFVSRIKQVLHVPAVRAAKMDPARAVLRVAVCGGAGASLLQSAIDAGADAFVTSDVTYHVFQDAEGRVLLLDAGHYETEYVFVSRCTGILRAALFESNGKVAIFPVSAETNPVSVL